MRIPALALASTLLAVGIWAAGFPRSLAYFLELPAGEVVSAVERGHPVDEADIEDALPALERAAATAPSVRGDLAMVLLAGARGEYAPERLARATEEFNAYLAAVPGDGRAWLLLADAERRQGSDRSALQALEMSVLTAPWMPGLLITRCALGIDLYPVLDDEGRRMIEEQFHLAAERSPRELAQMVQQRGAVLIARTMLIGSPEDMAKFESALAKL